MKCSCVIRRSIAFPEGVVVEMCARCSDMETAKAGRAYHDHVSPELAETPEPDATPPWEEDDSIPMGEPTEEDEEDVPWQR